MNDLDPAHVELSHRPLHGQRLLATCVAVAALIAAGLAVASIGVGGSSPGAPPTSVRATATGITIIVPGQRAQRIAGAMPIAGASERASEERAAYRYPDDGSLITVEGISSTARIRPDAAQAASSSRVGTVRILGDAVVARGLSMSARSSITNAQASGTLELAEGATLQVYGRTRAIRPNRQVVVDGLGTVSVNEQAILASAPRGDRQSGPRYRSVGAAIHIRLSAPRAGLPVGTNIIIGKVEAGVRRGKVRSIDRGAYRPAQSPSYTGSIVSGANPISLQPGSPRPGAATLPRRTANVAASASEPSGSLQGYVFPVLGVSSYSNDYGAPRASTGIPHQGNDIFAAEGTPIVAVADGVLDRVGWNSIGGYRFWLFDRYGNAFYNAHLSAFSPRARDGARVRAGDVIGFVGHTGDAQSTPPHLHFEIRPNNAGPVNPFPFLNAWKRGTQVPASVIGIGSELSPLSLLRWSDISANSGLGGSVLDRVPATGERPVAEETQPKPADRTLSDAITGPGIAPES